MTPTAVQPDSTAGAPRARRHKLAAAILATIFAVTGLSLLIAGLLSGGTGQARADARCDALRAQYGPLWPCIPSDPHTVTPTPYQPTTAPAGPTDGSGVHMGVDAGPGPGTGNGTPIVPVPGSPPAPGQAPGSSAPTAGKPVAPAPIPSIPATADAPTPTPPSESPTQSPAPGLQQQVPATAPHTAQPAISNDGTSPMTTDLLAVASAGLVVGATWRLRLQRQKAPAIVGGDEPPQPSLLPVGGSERGRVGNSDLVLINDPTSPKTYTFDEHVPPGGHIRINPDGSVTVVDKDGNPVRQIDKPWAYDSLGRPQKTWYTVDSDGKLVQHVQPTDDALYPILADPYVWNGSEWVWVDPENFQLAPTLQNLPHSDNPQGQPPTGAPGPDPSFKATDLPSLENPDNYQPNTSVKTGSGSTMSVSQPDSGGYSNVTLTPSDPRSAPVTSQLPVSDDAIADTRQSWQILPAGTPTPERGAPPAQWTTNDGSTHSLQIDESGQRTWNTTQSDGTTIGVVQGTDSSGKPWTRTTIKLPGQPPTTSYDESGVTMSVAQHPDGTNQTVVRNADGDTVVHNTGGGVDSITTFHPDHSRDVELRGLDGSVAQWRFDKDGNAQTLGSDGIWRAAVVNPDGSVTYPAQWQHVMHSGLERNEQWTIRPDGTKESIYQIRDGDKIVGYNITDYDAAGNMIRVRARTDGTGPLYDVPVNKNSAEIMYTAKEAGMWLIPVPGGGLAARGALKLAERVGLDGLGTKIIEKIPGLGGPNTSLGAGVDTLPKHVPSLDPDPLPNGPLPGIHPAPNTAPKSPPLDSTWPGTGKIDPAPGQPKVDLPPANKWPDTPSVSGLGGATKQPDLRASLGDGGPTAYRQTFFTANPTINQMSTVVHHAIEQGVLKRYPNLLTPGQINSLENLRGIPLHLNNEVHLSQIRKMWNSFYRTNPAPTVDDLLDFATVVDDTFGHLFTPPVR